MHNRPQSRGARQPPPQTGSNMNPAMSRAGLTTGIQRTVGLLADVKVTDRPLTQMGVKVQKGIDSSNANRPGRQIYDKSYYLTQLRQKQSDLREALGRFNLELVEIGNDNNTYQALEKRYESLIKSVRSLEGDLADHNLALDKQRTDSRPEEVQYLYQLLKQQNDQQRNELDSVFIEKKQHEVEIQKFDSILNEFIQQNEDKLLELHPEQRIEYGRLSEENKKLSNESMISLKNELDILNNNLAISENRLRAEPMRLRVSELKERKSSLIVRLRGLEQSTRESMLSIPEQRDLLLSKVKENNSEILRLEEKTKEVRNEVDNYKKQLVEMKNQNSQNGTNNTASENHKYELLHIKDQEITQFLDSFSENMHQEQLNLKNKQDEINHILEDISKYLGKSDHILNNMSEDITGELEFKTTQLNQSTETNLKLEAQVSKRRAELDKIKDLDKKIHSQLEGYREKMESMIHDMENKFKYTEEMKIEKINQTNELANRKQLLEVRYSKLMKHWNFLKIKKEGIVSELSENPKHKELEKCEEKVKQYELNNHHMRSFCRSKEAETDWRGVKRDIMSTCEELNGMIICGGGGVGAMGVGAMGVGSVGVGNVGMVGGRPY